MKCTKKETGQKRPESTPADSRKKNWESFPEPQGWAMGWHGEALSTQRPDTSK